MFKFEMSEEVTIQKTGERGEVEGRVEYIDSPSQYLVTYRDANGSLRSEWWAERHLAKK